MVELATCPHCGASNRGDAEWCGQCFERFGAAGPAAAVDLPPDPAPPADGVVTGAAVVAAVPAGDAAAEAEGERRGWQCRRCDQINAIELSVCSTCGTPIYDSYGASADGPATDPEAGLRRAIIFPGLGYGPLNYGGIGAVAGFLAVASLVVGGLLVLAGELVGIILLVSFLAIWAVSVLDVVRLAGGYPVPLLRPRVLSYVGGLVVAVALVTAVVAFGSATT